MECNFPSTDLPRITKTPKQLTPAKRLQAYLLPFQTNAHVALTISCWYDRNELPPKTSIPGGKSISYICSHACGQTPYLWN